jgi:hypothetical protein
MDLVSAHFDIPQAAETEGDVLGRVITRLNAGMAVVTPHPVRTGSAIILPQDPHQHRPVRPILLAVDLTPFHRNGT